VHKQPKTHPTRRPNVEEPRFGRLYYVLFGGALIVAIAVFLLMRGREEPEARELRRVLETARQAVIAKDKATGLSLLDESYTDNQRNDYARIKAEADRHDLSEVSDVAVKLRRITVELSPDKQQGLTRFEMRFSARVDDGTGRKIPILGVLNRSMPFGPTWESVLVRWVKNGGQWRIARVEVEPLQQTKRSS
jgi:hypothetical protein